jgi:hypothetical protein
MKRPQMLRTYHRVEIFVARRRFAFERFCETCGRPSEFVSLEDAMDASDLSMREVVRLAESGEVHFAESLGGYLAICERSLPKRIDREHDRELSDEVGQ